MIAKSTKDLAAIVVIEDAKKYIFEVGSSITLKRRGPIVNTTKAVSVANRLYRFMYDNDIPTDKFVVVDGSKEEDFRKIALKLLHSPVAYAQPFLRDFNENERNEIVNLIFAIKDKRR